MQNEPPNQSSAKAASATSAELSLRARAVVYQLAELVQSSLSRKRAPLLDDEPGLTLSESTRIGAI
eukprot:4403289-Prymnesium_polylepis.1